MDLGDLNYIGVSQNLAHFNVISKKC